MATFELSPHGSVPPVPPCPDPPEQKPRQDCVISLKVYDSCRRQNCLKPEELGPAHAAESVSVSGHHYREGEVIVPPANAASVTADKLRVAKIVITGKEPNQFKRGFWDIDLKFVFEYTLTFRETDGTPIAPGPVKAVSFFNERVTLFGSVGADIVISTDLFSRLPGDSTTLDADPFVLVEAKAVALDADLKYSRRRGYGPDETCPAPNEVLVTIGLFSIVKLFRIVQLIVDTRGFCVPEECHEPIPVSPCEFFKSLEFPMDIFAPPRREDFAEFAAQTESVPAGE